MLYVVDFVQALSVGSVVFSIANVLSFTRIVSLLPVNESLGQLQISYGRMLKDVIKFMIFYFAVMLAFACGLTNLYGSSRYDNAYFSRSARKHMHGIKNRSTKYILDGIHASAHGNFNLVTMHCQHPYNQIRLFF